MSIISIKNRGEKAVNVRTCGICGKYVLNEFDFKEHLKEHSLKEFITLFTRDLNCFNGSGRYLWGCPLCNIEFSLKSKFIEHFEDHSEHDYYHLLNILNFDYLDSNL